MSSAVVGPLSERAQSDAKTAQDEPRWSRDDPRWPEDASRRFQDDAKMDSRGHKLRRGKQKIVLSCKRNANFAKSAMQHPSSEVVTLKWRKIDLGRPRDGPRWPQGGLERPQVGTINPTIGVSCRRGANFATSAMHRPSSEVVSLKWRKIDVG